MKIAFFLVAFITTQFTLFSQNVLDSIHPMFKGELNGDLIRDNFSFSTNKSETARPQILLGAFISNKLSISGLLAVEKIPELKNFETGNSDIIEVPVNGYSGKFALPVFDSTSVIITANGINRQNAENYEFRILENKTKEIIPWHPITLFCPAYTLSYKPDGSEETEVAYLGQFKTSFGKSLTFEIRKKETAITLVSLSALWINRTPSVLGVFTQHNMQNFLKVFKKQWQHDILHETTRAERVYIDSSLILKTGFKSAENSLIFYLDDKIKSKEIIEYNLVSGNNCSGWKPNDFDLNLIWLKNLSPGKYTLQMRYNIQRHNVSEYIFSIAPAWHQTATFKIIAAILGLVLIGFVILIFRSRKQKQRFQIEQLEKQQIQTELKSIRSQFNPHFVFNALSSIQGLITKNDMDGANRYLTEFSTLLRDSLKESSKDSVSLFTEMKMLDSYLRLEQLRFGFTYSITADETIDKNAVEIPALLLQPLAENAVKHGISSLYDKGNLTINFKKSSLDMLAIISDNGNGFNPGETTAGYGLKLTHDRIVLLNKMLKGQSIGLSISSADEGTTVHLLFKNWLS